MNNSSSNSYSLSSIIGTFEDENGNTDEIVVPQEELINDLDPPVIPALGVSNANVTFDLSNSTLITPLRGTVIVVGISGSQVAHFVGNFECE